MLLSYALLVLANNTAQGYELSIYSSTPTIFWLAIIFGLLNGLFLIASCLYGKNGKNWIIGIFQIIFCNCLVISLYALRGYVLYLGRGDVPTYVGLSKDISEFGNFGSNFYPITSILISQISQLSKLPIIVISKYIPSLFYIFYVLSIYCWSKSLIANRKFILSSLIASMVIFFAWFSTSIYHQVLFVWTLPFFFYLLQKNQDYRFRLFSIIFIIMNPFFHPITAIVVLLYLMVFSISEKFYINEKKKNVSLSLLLISFVTLLAWFIQQYILLGSLKIIFFQLVGLLTATTTADNALYYMDILGITTAIRTFFLMIMDEAVFCLISLIVIYRILLRKKILIMQKFSKLYICFIIGNLFLLILFFSTSTHRPDRLINLNFNMMFTPPLVGYLIYDFLLNNKRAKAVLILSLIFISAVTAIFSLYPSPITLRPNNQIANSDLMGMNWLIIKKNPELKTVNIKSSVYRYADLIYGRIFRRGRSDLVSHMIFPDHFGFTEKNIFPIDEDRYLVITEYDIRGYTEVWKELDRFGKKDFIKIDFCTNVDKIYENGDLRNYFVNKDD